MGKNAFSWKEKTKSVWNNKGLYMIVFIILMIIPFVISSFNIGVGDDIRRDGIVVVGGEEIFRVPLSSKTPHQEVVLYPTEDTYVVIEYSGPKIRIKESTGTNLLPVKRGWIQHPGETIVHLELGLMLKVTSVVDEVIDEDVSNRTNPSPF